MLKTVEGIYRDGRIELANLPENVGDRSSVLITFLDAGIIGSAPNLLNTILKSNSALRF